MILKLIFGVVFVLVAVALCAPRGGNGSGRWA